MSKAHVINEFGSPEVMQWRDWHVPDPSPGEVRLRHTAIGVNFADTYHRGGISHPWKVDTPPFVIVFEGVGIVEGVGEGVTNFKTGYKVAYGIPPLGSYAETRNYHELIYAFGRLSMGGDPIPLSIRNTLRMDAHWDDTWLRNDCY